MLAPAIFVPAFFFKIQKEASFHIKEHILFSCMWVSFDTYSGLFWHSKRNHCHTVYIIYIYNWLNIFITMTYIHFSHVHPYDTPCLFWHSAYKLLSQLKKEFMFIYVCLFYVCRTHFIYTGLFWHLYYVTVIYIWAMSNACSVTVIHVWVTECDGDVHTHGMYYSYTDYSDIQWVSFDTH